MPKPTFENLPAAKRQVIIDLAVAEFAERPYEAASLSRIVERAGIAKGSIYQYFENKQDLYLFTIEYAAQQQLAILSEQVPPAPGLGFFALLRWQVRASVQVGLAAPEFTRLMYRAVTDELPFRDEVEGRLHAAGEGHLQALLAQGVAEGAIDPTIDLELAAFAVRGLLGAARDLIIRRLGLSLGAVASNVAALDSPAAEALYDQVIQLLRHGIGARPAGEEGAER